MTCNFLLWIYIHITKERLPCHHRLIVCDNLSSTRAYLGDISSSKLEYRVNWHVYLLLRNSCDKQKQRNCQPSEMPHHHGILENRLHRCHFANVFHHIPGRAAVHMNEFNIIEVRRWICTVSCLGPITVLHEQSHPKYAFIRISAVNLMISINT